MKEYLKRSAVTVNEFYYLQSGFGSYVHKKVGDRVTFTYNMLKCKKFKKLANALKFKETVNDLPVIYGQYKTVVKKFPG